jgi:hypothetical protein
MRFLKARIITPPETIPYIPPSVVSKVASDMTSLKRKPFVAPMALSKPISL